MVTPHPLPASRRSRVTHTRGGPSRAAPLVLFDRIRTLPPVLRLAFVFASAWLLATQALFFRHTYDDVFIIARYADNLASGVGLVFNPGERVEGATTLTWVALVAAASRLGADPVVAAKVLGGLFVLAIPWLQLELAARLASAPVGVVAAVLTALSAPIALWAVNGLETGFQAFWITLGLVVAMRDLERPAGFPWGALVFLIATLTRPEAILVAGIYGCMLLWLAARGRVPWRKTAAATLLLGLGLAAVTVWRLWYFGAPLPNTFYAKVTNEALWPARGGTLYLRSYLDGLGWSWLMAALVPLIASRPKPLGLPIVLVAGAVACQAAFVLWVGGDWMAGYRLLVPVLPAFFVLVAWGLTVAWESVRVHLGTAARRAAFLGVVASCGVFLASQDTHRLLGQVQGYTTSLERTQVALGHWLRDNSPRGATVALADCGAVPYLSSLRTIDLLGLLDPFIARHQPVESVRDLFERRRPELLVIASPETLDARSRLSSAFFAMDRVVVTHPEFWRQYRHVRTWISPGPYHLHLFARRDLEETRGRMGRAAG